MHRKFWTIVLSLAGALLLTGGLLAAVPPVSTDTAVSADMAAAPQAPADLTPTHWLTVTTTSDDGGMSERCETVSPCTLRRAINEVNYHGLDVTKRVYHIAFDIPTGDSGYDAGNGVWIINVDSDNSSETFAFRSFGSYGHAIIDGTTQPVGRDLNIGPRIILRGDNEKGAFNLSGGYNTVRGLAFQGFGDNMVNMPATNNNLVEGNWFGLNVAGDDIYLRNPLVPEDGSGEGGIYAQMSGSNGTTNTIQSNVLAGFHGVAISVQGDHNTVLSNTVGTRADGTVPEVRDDRKCKPNARYYNWFPGAGIDIFGEDNLVAYNRVVGLLFQSNDPLNTPDDAISVTGRNHVVRDNIIGVTSDDVPFGTCGEGIHIGGVSGGHFIQVRDNLVVGAQGAAGIYIAAGELGYDLDAVTVQGNVILDSTVQAFDFSPTVPAALRNFNPAAITDIDGMDVTGTSGAGSLCEDCVIEVFLDNHDTVTETLESLGTTTADGSGNWSFPLGRTLALTEGLRTASTTVADGQIHNASSTITYSAGTTTKISEIYTQAGAPEPVDPLPPVPEAPLPVVWPTYMAQPTAPGAPNLIITVTTTADPDDLEQYVCYNAAYPGVVGKTNRLPCTLRQAIEEAESVMAANPAVRPVEIRFALSTGDAGYDVGLGAWVIQLTDTLKLNALPTLGSTDVNKAGQVTIDGSAQAGGRSTGPKIIVRGPQNRDLVALVVNGNNNVIRGIAFQKFDTALQLNHSQNIVEDNWFGLDNLGTDLYWRSSEAPEDGSGLGGIKVADNTTQTLIQNNALAGFKGAAIDVEGDESFILDNLVGTRADGTVPEVAWNRWCRPNARYHNWFGGAGVEVGGERNQVTGNRIAGLLWVSDDPQNTPDDALSVTGGDHLIQENIIGVDALGSEVGSCGRGLVVDAGFTRVLSNTVVRTALEPFRINGTQTSINALYTQGNLSWDAAPIYLEWGNLVPEARKLFTPSVVLSITVGGGSTTVYGAAASDMPCPYCQVELFLDDLDVVTETLESVARVQSDVNGEWHTTLPFALGLDEGLRTASTAFNYGIVANFDGPSTSNVSTAVYSRTGATPPGAPPDPVFLTPPVIPDVAYKAPPTAPPSYATTITVTTTADNATVPPAGSFRWAINQVKNLTSAQRPALIAFDIPTTDTGYNVNGYWVITLTSSLLPPVKGGQVTIDGTTQIGGRVDDPQIILRRNTSTGDKLLLGETQDEGEYVVKGLAFQGVEVHMSGDDNIISHNWLGLNDMGDAIRLYGGDPRNQNHAIIVAAADSDHNHIAYNALAGSSTNAINIQGYDGLIEHNTIGTLPDGTIPADAVDPVDVCQHTQLTGNWYGGGGIVISGKRHVVQDNVLAGLMLASTNAMQTQPSAVQILNGRDHLVQDNRIGVQSNGVERWTCGRAVENGGADYTHILSNTIANGATQGILVNGNIIEINATTMEGNVISNTTSAIEFGPGTPVTLSAFAPALVTRINGVNVTGTADDPCPYCRVDVYRDDDDPTTEALVYLGAAYANANGNWSFVLPVELEEGEGLRTQSTTRDYGVLQYFEAGTSSGLSILFEPQPLTAPASVTITPPAVGDYAINVAYTFSAGVSPITATLPITYTWQATDQMARTVAGGPENEQTFTWTLEGTKYITVTVDNGLGSPVRGTYSIEVKSDVNYPIYLPLVLRNH